MTDESLIFIHLSDIHFRCWSGSEYDIDGDLRNELLLDAQRVATDLVGQPKGILITGDIAFSGASEEYSFAGEWLTRLCEMIGRTREVVWCVPGNHDVKRSYIQESFALSSMHDRLRQSAEDEIDKEIGICMRDSAAAELSFQSIAAYNSFAAAFQCRINPKKPVWQQNFSLNDRSTLCVHGLNSTLVSDSLDDINKNVILGKYQIPKRVPGVTNLVMCHHPPDWWKDADNVEQMLDDRAQIELFGHKHAQRLVKINSTLRLTAGAVHPDRGKNWIPYYNWFSIKVLEGDERKLAIDVYPRIWNKEGSNFTADYKSCNGEDHRKELLDLEPWSSPPTGTYEPQELGGHEASAASLPGPRTEAEIMDPVRVLTYRFLDLAHVIRIDIARELGLLKDEDEGLQDYELFERIFTRAVRGDMLAQLWDKVEQKHNDKKYGSNPFRTQ